MIMPQQTPETNNTPSSPRSRFYILGRILAGCFFLLACSCSCFALIMGWAFGSSPADEVVHLPDGTQMVTISAYPIVLLFLIMSMGTVLVLITTGGSILHLFGQKHTLSHRGSRSIALLLSVISLLLFSCALVNGVFGMVQISMPQLPGSERFLGETPSADTLQASVLMTTLCMGMSLFVGGLGIGAWFLLVQKRLQRSAKEMVQPVHAIASVQTEIQVYPDVTTPTQWQPSTNLTKTYEEFFTFLRGKDLYLLDELERSEVSKHTLDTLTQMTTQEKISLIVSMYREGLLMGENAVDLTGASLQGIQLVDMDLSSINLSGAELESANFHNSRLQHAIFKFANLQKADFRFTDLQSANFQNGVLTRAKFHKASLEGADLTLAQLSETNFWGANLTNVKVTQQQLQQAKLKDTILP